MTYEKQTWNTGDTITAEKLNHMEEGIDDNSTVLTVNSTTDDGGKILDKTYNEIKAAYLNGVPVIIVDSENYTYDLVYGVYEYVDPSQYTVSIRNKEYNADNADDYPFYAY